VEKFADDTLRFALRQTAGLFTAAQSSISADSPLLQGKRSNKAIFAPSASDETEA